ncbi:hypothetical protein [Terasakiella sp. SH-1]|uniref:hypothetical protein n=1 Tax=Terasakiella sp. SH-1 TaxID=2560057 RepID=UPI0010738FAD|nr:hypothetical protein [Terasakiella sp. SH-1]
MDIEDYTTYEELSERIRYHIPSKMKIKEEIGRKERTKGVSDKLFNTRKNQKQEELEDLLACLYGNRMRTGGISKFMDGTYRISEPHIPIIEYCIFEFTKCFDYYTRQILSKCCEMYPKIERLEEERQRVRDQQKDQEARIKAEREEKKREKESKIKAEQDRKKREEADRVKAEQDRKNREEKARGQAILEQQKREHEAKVKAEQERKKREEEARIKAEEEQKIQKEREIAAYNRDLTGRIFNLDKYNPDDWPKAFEIYQEVFFDEEERANRVLKDEISELVTEIKQIRSEQGQKAFAQKQADADRQAFENNLSQASGLSEFENMKNEIMKLGEE